MRSRSGTQRNCSAVVAHERAGQQMRFAEDLEAVADTDDRLAGFGVAGDGLHHGREARDGAGAQVVAVGEAAGNDDGVVGVEVRLPVPDEVSLLAHLVGEDVLAVAFGPGAGKDEDGELHGGSVARRRRNDRYRIFARATRCIFTHRAVFAGWRATR